MGDRVMGSQRILSPRISWHQPGTSSPFQRPFHGSSGDRAGGLRDRVVCACPSARIAKGEDVLIHGGAGGVGLAAIQIAKSFGSNVIASASSPERRAIAKAAGADFAYDSRQERFAEAIRQSHGGVDVVLNSLAGQAMIASFKLLKAFGRFVELGKVDYLSNTHLGLRPFRAEYLVFRCRSRRIARA